MSKSTWIHPKKKAEYTGHIESRQIVPMGSDEMSNDYQFMLVPKSGKARVENFSSHQAAKKAGWIKKK
jgi:hypothetical protein